MKKDVKDIDFYYKKNRLSQIRGFCSVVQNGCSISRAHEKTRIELSTLSKEIRSLERDLGVDLLDRTGYNKLKLTSEGELFYKEAVQYVNGIDGLVDSFSKQLNDYRNNNIRIASNDIILSKLLPYLNSLKQKYPKIKISLFNISKEEAYSMLKNKELDLAFYLEDVYEKLPVELEKEKLSDHISYWIFPKDHPLAKKDEKDIKREDFAGYPFIIFEGMIFTKSYQNFIDEFNLHCPIYVRNGNINLTIDSVKAGFGITSISEIFLSEKDRNFFALKDTKYILPQIYFYCFFRKNMIKSNIVDEFLKIVKDNHETIFH
ncbi:MAG TPA: LysR family transcriptional regulator [Rickettsiales bacterium]|nr:LysR family transcriptional regulator [Rickettsiales bacterium]